MSVPVRFRPSVQVWLVCLFAGLGAIRSGGRDGLESAWAKSVVRSPNMIVIWGISSAGRAGLGQASGSIPQSVAMYYVYILKSLKDGRLYTGVTQDLEHRLAEHNIGKNKVTRHRRPLVLVHSEFFATRGEAAKREYYLKPKKGSFDKFKLAHLK